MNYDEQIASCERAIYDIGLELRNVWNLSRNDAEALKNSCEARTKELKVRLRKLRADREKTERDR